MDGIDADKGTLDCTQASLDRSYVREKGIAISTDAAARYWKAGQAAKFADIKIGDKLRTKTHGIGKGKVQMCWEVFLDDESLLKFQSEQKAVHAKRMAEEGAPGYVDKLTGRELDLTLFQEAGDIARQLKPGQKVRVAAAGVDRKPAGAPVTGIIAAAKMAGNLGKVTLTLDAASADFHPAGVTRLWIAH